MTVEFLTGFHASSAPALTELLWEHDSSYYGEV
jgi:hypothetical protein